MWSGKGRQRDRPRLERAPRHPPLSLRRTSLATRSASEVLLCRLATASDCSSSSNVASWISSVALRAASISWGTRTEDREESSDGRPAQSVSQ